MKRKQVRYKYTYVDEIRTALEDIGRTIAARTYKFTIDLPGIKDFLYREYFEELHHKAARFYSKLKRESPHIVSDRDGSVIRSVYSQTHSRAVKLMMSSIAIPSPDVKTEAKEWTKRHLVNYSISTYKRQVITKMYRNIHLGSTIENFISKLVRTTVGVPGRKIMFERNIIGEMLEHAVYDIAKMYAKLVLDKDDYNTYGKAVIDTLYDYFKLTINAGFYNDIEYEFLEKDIKEYLKGLKAGKMPDSTFVKNTISRLKNIMMKQLIKDPEKNGVISRIQAITGKREGVYSKEVFIEIDKLLTLAIENINTDKIYKMADVKDTLSNKFKQEINRVKSINVIKHNLKPSELYKDVVIAMEHLSPDTLNVAEKVFSYSIRNVFNKYKNVANSLYEISYDVTSIANSRNKDFIAARIVKRIYNTAIKPYLKEGYYPAFGSETYDVNLVATRRGLRRLINSVLNLNEKHTIAGKPKLNMALSIRKTKSGLPLLRVTFSVGSNTTPVSPEETSMSFEFPLPIGLLVASKHTDTPRKLVPIALRTETGVKTISQMDMVIQVLEAKLNDIKHLLEEKYYGEGYEPMSIRQMQRRIQASIDGFFATLENFSVVGADAFKDSNSALDIILKSLINPPRALRDRAYYMTQELHAGRISLRNLISTMLERGSSFTLLDIENVPTYLLSHRTLRQYSEVAKNYRSAPWQFGAISVRVLQKPSSTGYHLAIEDITNEYINFLPGNMSRKEKIQLFSEIFRALGMGDEKRAEEVVNRLEQGRGLAEASQIIMKYLSLDRSFVFGGNITRGADAQALRKLQNMAGGRLNDVLAAANDLRASMLVFYTLYGPHYRDGRINPVFTYIQGKTGSTVEDFVKFFFGSEEELRTFIARKIANKEWKLSDSKMQRRILKALASNAYHDAFYDSLVELAIMDKFVEDLSIVINKYGEERVLDEIERFTKEWVGVLEGDPTVSEDTLRMVLRHYQGNIETNLMSEGGIMSAKILFNKNTPTLPFALSTEKQWKKALTSDMSSLMVLPPTLVNRALKVRKTIIDRFGKKAEREVTIRTTMGYLFDSYFDILDESMAAKQGLIPRIAGRRMLTRAIYPIAGITNDMGAARIYSELRNSISLIRPEKTEKKHVIKALMLIAEDPSYKLPLNEKVQRAIESDAEYIISSKSPLFNKIKEAVTELQSAGINPNTKEGKAALIKKLETTVAKVYESEIVTGNSLIMLTKDKRRPPAAAKYIVKNVAVKVLSDTSTNNKHNIYFTFELEKLDPLELGSKIVGQIAKSAINEEFNLDSMSLVLDQLAIAGGDTGELARLVGLIVPFSPIQKKGMLGSMMTSSAYETAMTIKERLASMDENTMRSFLGNKIGLIKEEIDTTIRTLNDKTLSEAKKLAYLINILYRNQIEDFAEIQKQIKSRTAPVNIERAEQAYRSLISRISYLKEMVGDVWTESDIKKLKDEYVAIKGPGGVRIKRADEAILDLMKSYKFADPNANNLVGLPKFFILFKQGPNDITAVDKEYLKTIKSSIPDSVSATEVLRNTIAFVGAEEFTVTHWPAYVGRIHKGTELFKPGAGIKINLSREPKELIFAASEPLMKTLYSKVLSYADITGEGAAVLAVERAMNEGKQLRDVVTNELNKDELTKLLDAIRKRSIVNLQKFKENPNVALEEAKSVKGVHAINITDFIGIEKKMEGGAEYKIVTLTGTEGNILRKVFGVLNQERTSFHRFIDTRTGHFTAPITRIDLTSLKITEVNREALEAIGAGHLMEVAKKGKLTAADIISALMGLEGTNAMREFYIPSVWVEGRLETVTSANATAHIMYMPDHTATALRILEILNSGVITKGKMKELSSLILEYRKFLSEAARTKNGSITEAFKSKLPGIHGSIVASPIDTPVLDAFVNIYDFNKLLEERGFGKKKRRAIFALMKQGKLTAEEIRKVLGTDIHGFVVADPVVNFLAPLRVLPSTKMPKGAIAMHPALLLALFRDIDWDQAGIAAARSIDPEIEKYRSEMIMQLAQVRRAAAKILKNTTEAMNFERFKALVLEQDPSINKRVLDLVLKMQYGLGATGVVLPPTEPGESVMFVPLVQPEQSGMLTHVYNFRNNELIELITSSIASAEKEQTEELIKRIMGKSSISSLDTSLRRAAYKLVRLYKYFNMDPAIDAVKRLYELKETAGIKEAVRQSNLVMEKLGNLTKESMDVLSSYEYNYILSHLEDVRMYRGILQQYGFTPEELKALKLAQGLDRRIFGNSILYPIEGMLMTVGVEHLAWANVYSEDLRTQLEEEVAYVYRHTARGVYRSALEDIKDTLHLYELTDAMRKAAKPFRDFLQTTGSQLAALEDFKTNSKFKDYVKVTGRDIISHNFNIFKDSVSKMVKELTPKHIALLAAFGGFTISMLRKPRLDMVGDAGEKYDWRGWGGDLGFGESILNPPVVPFRKQKIRLLHASPQLQANMIQYQAQKLMHKYSPGIFPSNEYSDIRLNKQQKYYNRVMW